MDESAIKRLELLELNGSGADIRESRCISRICVEGYDTSLDDYDVDSALRTIFASCGEITHVYIPKKDLDGPLNRFAFIYLRGEGAEEKALKLNESDVGGWNVVVKAYPFQETFLDTELAPMRAEGQWRHHRMMVTGFDTSLPVDDVKRMLCKHFSLSGEVESNVVTFEEPNGCLRCNALLFIKEEDAVEKALELSGRDVGGLNIEVIKVMPPRLYNIGYRGSRTE